MIKNENVGIKWPKKLVLNSESIKFKKEGTNNEKE